MEYVREIINSEKLRGVVDLPLALQGREVEITVLPAIVSFTKTTAEAVAEEERERREAFEKFKTLRGCVDKGWTVEKIRDERLRRQVCEPFN